MPRAFFRKLKGLMYETDVGQQDLARLLNRSPCYIALRQSAKAPYTMDEVYAICDYFEIPYEQIPEYFPPKGVALKTKYQLKSVTERVSTGITT